MQPDALPQRIATLLPRLDAAQLRELLQQLPDRRAAAEEMVRRGWITQDQFSSLFPEPPPTSQKTVLLDVSDDENPSVADCENWDLILTDEDMLPEPMPVEAVPVLSGAASTPQFERNMVVPPMADGNQARPRESNTDKLPRPWPSWASKDLLTWAVFLGSLLLALPFFGTRSTVPSVAGQESSQPNAAASARAVDMPPAPPIIPVKNANQRDDLLNRTGPNARPIVPVAVPPRAPKSAASLYDRVRQVVLENKTEETQRLGMGDIAYQNVPDDGSIMVGMEVTYAPFFNHNIIKSVRPIYQRADGTRYDGPVCGNPTGVGERVVAREGYAIGAAAIKAGMGIDGMQLTFMEIGAEGLNANKTYLSKWLGGYGGADAKTYVNDGRPIVGIAGMRSKDPKSPAFCMCLVTTRTGAIADADGSYYQSSPVIAKQRDDLPNRTEQNAQPPAPAVEPVGPKPTLTLNVHVANYQAWPAIEARIKALADSPNLQCKFNRSGEYMWVYLSPMNVDPDAFARKINFGKIVAVYPDQRLIYVDSKQ
jgi:hypothetical protein